MASKKRRKTIGSILKSKTAGDPDYLKISEDVTLKKGTILQLRSKSQELAQINAAVSAGKLDEQYAAKAIERAEKIPTFVRFQVILLEEVTE